MKHTVEQQKAILHISLENCSKSDVIHELKDFIRDVPGMPSGATITETTGLWFPRKDDGSIDEELAEHEDGLNIEIWIDEKPELEAVKYFRDHLEQMFSQWCICLETTTSTFQHTHEGGGE